MKKILMGLLFASLAVGALTGTVLAAPRLAGANSVNGANNAEASQVAPTENPVGALLASFFGLEYSSVETLQTSGAGYGEIAQACWMSYQLVGDSSQCALILQAKQSGNYSGLTLPNGQTVTNWGQLMKVVFAGSRQNLGSIVSGRATLTPATPTPTPGLQSLPANGNSQGNGFGQGMGVGNGNGQGSTHRSGHGPWGN